MQAQLVVRMPRELRATLEEIAREERRPLGNLVRNLLEDAVSARSKRKRR